MMSSRIPSSENHSAPRIFADKSKQRLRSCARRRFDAPTWRQEERPRRARSGDIGELASEVLHFLAIRSRAGESRAALEATAEAALAFLCEAARPRA